MSGTYYCEHGSWSDPKQCRQCVAMVDTAEECARLRASLAAAERAREEAAHALGARDVERLKALARAEAAEKLLADFNSVDAGERVAHAEARAAAAEARERGLREEVEAARKVVDLCWQEIVKSGNAGARDFGWPAARTAVEHFRALASPAPAKGGTP